MLKVNNHPLRKWLIVELFIQVSIVVYLEILKGIYFGVLKEVV